MNGVDLILTKTGILAPPLAFSERELRLCWSWLRLWPWPQEDH